MFTLYTVLLSIHILAVAVWVGGGMMLTHLLGRLRRDPEPPVAARLLSDIATIGQRVLAPSSLIVVAAGFGLVAKGNWDFKLWLILGVVAWLGSAAHGAMYMGPQSEKLSQEIAAGTADAQTIRARVGTIMTHGLVEEVILMLIIFDMVIKPGT